MTKVPETQLVAVTMGGDRVAIMQFVTKSYTASGVEFEREATDENIYAEMVKAGLADGAKSFRRIAAEEIPADRTFRDAWRDDGKIGVDMEKARGVHMARIRRARGQKLADLDVDWMRAAARKDQTNSDAIEDKRQALRDLPHTFDLSKAETPEQLKAMWPKELT